MTGEAFELSLDEASRRLRNGTLSSVDLVESSLARIASTNEEMNAFVTVTADRAREAAAVADAELAGGRYRGRLHGIPLGVKDIYDVAGVATGCGSAVREGHVATATATVVSRLEAAGMIVLGKTTTHEFALGGITPLARNPWDLDRSPGGSSGGSGAAVASGQCLVATGTDTAGSIRIPAAACGVVGLKPSYGRVPRGGITPLSWSFDTAGALTRGVADAALVLQTIAGPDSADPASLDVPVPDYSERLDEGVDGVRLGMLGGFFADRVEPHILDAVARAASVLERAGARVQSEIAPHAEEASGILRIIDLPEASAYHRRDLRDRPGLYSPQVRGALEAGLFIPAVDYVQAQRARLTLARAWGELFSRVDALVAPTLAIAAPRAGQEHHDWDSGGREPVRDAVVRMTCPVNVAGLPAIALPIGIDASGAPMSMQLIGPPFGEQKLLRIARAYELGSDTVGRIVTPSRPSSTTSMRG